MTTAAIIVAAGSGQRFGNAGKSFVLLRGRPMAWWSLRAASGATAIDEIVLVCGAHSFDVASELVLGFPASKPVWLVIGGTRRQDSAKAGIEATSPGSTVVAIHDAARPMVTEALFDDAIAAAAVHGAAIAAIPVSDTIKRVEDGLVLETLPREKLVSVQTPQAFRKQLLLDAFAHAERTGLSVTDEATLIEQMGGRVQVVPGSVSNIKMTVPEDLVIAEALLAQRDGL
jgi:2-C-methyl-D-erythritol 4-phosphate cytidylyltransferase